MAVLISELQGDINRVSVMADLHVLADKYQPRKNTQNGDNNKGKRKGDGDESSKSDRPRK